MTVAKKRARIILTIFLGPIKTISMRNALLEIWWSSMPTWVRDAYLNDPTVNRIIKECSMVETSREEMQWRLCAALFEQRNQWRETALAVERNKPAVYFSPKIES